MKKINKKKPQQNEETEAKLEQKCSSVYIRGLTHVEYLKEETFGSWND